MICISLFALLLAHLMSHSPTKMNIYTHEHLFTIAACEVQWGGHLHQLIILVGCYSKKSENHWSRPRFSFWFCIGFEV